MVMPKTSLRTQGFCQQDWLLKVWCILKDILDKKKYWLFVGLCYFDGRTEISRFDNPMAYNKRTAQFWAVAPGNLDCCY
jgi:hypothetical protein